MQKSKIVKFFTDDWNKWLCALFLLASACKITEALSHERRIACIEQEHHGVAWYTPSRGQQAEQAYRRLDDAMVRIEKLEKQGPRIVAAPMPPALGEGWQLLLYNKGTKGVYIVDAERNIAHHTSLTLSFSGGGE